MCLPSWLYIVLSNFFVASIDIGRYYLGDAGYVQDTWCHSVAKGTIRITSREYVWPG